MDNKTMDNNDNKESEEQFYMNAKYTFELDEKQGNLNTRDAAEVSMISTTIPNNYESTNDVAGDRTSGSTPTNYHVNRLYEM